MLTWYRHFTLVYLRYHSLYWLGTCTWLWYTSVTTYCTDLVQALHLGIPPLPLTVLNWYRPSLWYTSVTTHCTDLIQALHLGISPYPLTVLTWYRHFTLVYLRNHWLFWLGTGTSPWYTSVTTHYGDLVQALHFGIPPLPLTILTWYRHFTLVYLCNHSLYWLDTGISPWYNSVTTHSTDLIQAFHLGIPP
jgi:hypothetical protein